MDVVSLRPSNSVKIVQELNIYRRLHLYCSFHGYFAMFPLVCFRTDTGWWQKWFPFIIHRSFPCMPASDVLSCLHSVCCLCIFSVHWQGVERKCLPSHLHNAGVQYTLFQPQPELSLKITKRGQCTSLTAPLPFFSAIFLCFKWQKIYIKETKRVAAGRG